MRRVLVGMAVVLLVVGGVPLAGGQASGGPGAINVVSADDEGCSGDQLSAADMRITIRVDGLEVLQTQKAQDEEEPLFAELVAGIDAASGVSVSIEAWEAEPGGSFGFGTVWESCDTDPGPGRSFTFTWHGEDRVVTTRGGDSDAAEVVVVLGSGAPAPPMLAVQPASSSADVSWSAPPGAEGQRLTWGDAGDLIAALGPTATSHQVTGLCENSDYTVRLVRDQEPWHVGSDDVGFHTLNAAPLAPRVLAADLRADGSGWTVAAELPSYRDLFHVEIHHHPSDPAFQPGAGSLVQTNSTVVWSPDEQFSVNSTLTTGYVRLRAVDQGGLSSVSEAFMLGGTHAAPQPAPACDGGWYQPASTSSPPAPVGDDDPVEPEDDGTGTPGPGGFTPVPGGADDESPESVQGDAEPSFDPWTNPMVVGIAVGAVVLFLAVAIGLTARRR